MIILSAMIMMTIKKKKPSIMFRKMTIILKKIIPMMRS